MKDKNNVETLITEERDDDAANLQAPSSHDGQESESDAGTFHDAVRDETSETTESHEALDALFERCFERLRLLARSESYPKFPFGKALLDMAKELARRNETAGAKKRFLGDMYNKLGLSRSKAEALMRVARFIMEKSPNEVNFEDDDDPVLNVCAQVGHSKLDLLRRLPSEMVTFTEDNRIVLTARDDAGHGVETDAREFSANQIRGLSPSRVNPAGNTDEQAQGEPDDPASMDEERSYSIDVKRREYCPQVGSVAPRRYAYSGGHLNSGENGFDFVHDESASIAFCVEEQVNPQTGAITGSERTLFWFDADAGRIVSFNLPDVSIEEPGDEEQLPAACASH